MTRTTWVLAAAAVLIARAPAGGVLVTSGAKQHAQTAQQSPMNTAKVETREFSPMVSQA